MLLIFKIHLKRPECTPQQKLNLDYFLRRSVYAGAHARKKEVVTTGVHCDGETAQGRREILGVVTHFPTEKDIPQKSSADKVSLRADQVKGSICKDTNTYQQALGRGNESSAATKDKILSRKRNGRQMQIVRRFFRIRVERNHLRNIGFVARYLLRILKKLRHNLGWEDASIRQLPS